MNENNIMTKVEELVIKKLGEYKEVFAMEFKKNIGSMSVSDEEKKFQFSRLIFIIIFYSLET